MRENRPYGSEGGEGHNLSRPLSRERAEPQEIRFMLSRVDAVGGDFAEDVELLRRMLEG